jgi:AcrR family transcriptional regulator
MSFDQAPVRPGLRQRKKAKTMAAIRACALRLFAEHGYETTTVEQIADAAEVSTSTFFRYFPTKEAVVLSDEYDPLLIRAFEAQPTGLHPVQAMRRAYRTVLGGMSPDELASVRQRASLMQSVPALRSAFFVEMAQGLRRVEDLAARWSGRDRRDPAVRAFGGAVMGVLTAAFFHWMDDADQDIAALVDEALAELERGLRL